MEFFQTPPSLGNQFQSDRVLRSYIDRNLPIEMQKEIEPQLDRLGELAGGQLYERSVADRLDEPKLTQWNAWGNRIDRIEITPFWRELESLAAREGLVSIPYERRHGALSRIHQFALLYLFDSSSAVYTCPLAMTDGAAKTLSVSKNQALIDRAVSRLISRDPSRAWTSGQWMTERTGGSDVAISETRARKTEDGFLLYGTKWFTSATTSQMALTLARPEGNPPGGSGLALFFLELRNPDGSMNGIQVNRLKDKLGTRMVPTAELSLDGARAIPVYGTSDGIKNIAPMLNITRTWNAIGAISGMRRGIALARNYSKNRIAFGAPLSEKALHLDTLAGLQAEFEGAFHLTFRAVELLGREEAGELDPSSAQLLRILTPLIKLTTGKQAVAIASESLEAFGGAGYVEDTGLPRLLRDAQVLPIWEGTTNVLSLDAIRALGRTGTLEPIEHEIRERTKRAADAKLEHEAAVVHRAVDHASQWLARARDEGIHSLESGARRFALTLGRSLELALLIDHAVWAHSNRSDSKPVAAARRFARHGVDQICDDLASNDSKLLANDE